MGVEPLTGKSVGVKTHTLSHCHCHTFFSIGATFHRYDRTPDRNWAVLSGLDISVADNWSVTIAHSPQSDKLETVVVKTDTLLIRCECLRKKNLKNDSECGVYD